MGWQVEGEIYMLIKINEESIYSHKKNSLIRLTL